MSEVTKYELVRTERYSYTVSSDDEDFIEHCKEQDIDPLDANESDLLEFDREHLDCDDYSYEESDTELEYIV